MPAPGVVAQLENEFRQLAAEARSKEGLAGFFSNAGDQQAVKDAAERIILKVRGYADSPDALDQIKAHYQVGPEDQTHRGSRRLSLTPVCLQPRCRHLGFLPRCPACPNFCHLTVPAELSHIISAGGSEAAAVEPGNQERSAEEPCAGAHPEPYCQPCAASRGV